VELRIDGDSESGNTASMNDDVKAKPGGTVTKTQEHRKGNFMRCPGPGSEVACHSSFLELIIISTCGDDSTRKEKYSLPQINHGSLGEDLFG